ncbi:hypothetical protein J0871_04165 [Salegentibacter sp. BDJ18]|uniref:hypothetical protein n=1 Tax=Salegentibacter sp. BDJ18 TaxID=2816376 RepID=UPI001AAE827A|nr:hypothetical protein [Salegentibacter sp. BDJ18]MBO2543602.1 hypothetical protein [Salegentibacter sp. BDJ18]
MFKQLFKLFIESSEEFLRSEVDLILSDVSERCLCGSLMTKMRYNLDNSIFNEYHADIEYNRNFDGRIKTIINNEMKTIPVTCDIIIHSRGEIQKQDNLLAVEMKKANGKEEDKQKDKERLMALTKSGNDSNTYSMDGRTFPENVCGYLLGVFYEVDIENRIVFFEYYKGGELFSKYRKKF